MFEGTEFRPQIAIPMFDDLVEVVDIGRAGIASAGNADHIDMSVAEQVADLDTQARSRPDLAETRLEAAVTRPATGKKPNMPEGSS